MLPLILPGSLVLRSSTFSPTPTESLFVQSSVWVEKFLLLFPMSCLVSGLGKLPQVDFLNQDGERGSGWKVKAFGIQF